MIAEEIENRQEIVEVVYALLGPPRRTIDYAQASWALDRMLASSAAPEQLLNDLEEIAETAWELLGPGSQERERLQTLRELLYVPSVHNQFCAPVHNDPELMEAANPLNC